MPLEKTPGLAAVLDAIRTNHGITAPELGRQLGLGRSVISQRVTELESSGLVLLDGYAPSTGGRAPRALRLRSEAGVVAGIDIGATGMVVAIADLRGHILGRREVAVEVVEGPAVVLDLAAASVKDLHTAYAQDIPLWGVGVGVPGPVEFATGLPVAPPIMPGWDGYPIRADLAARFDAPVWVDNDVNLRALGELRCNPAAAQVGDVMYVKIGTGIGAGLISAGRLHRGSNGCAGDIGHVAVADAGDVVCRCGNVGCLEATAGGAALARDATELAASGASATLAEILTSRPLTAADVATAATSGDAAAKALLVRAGRLVGDTLATLVSFYNPSLVAVGGRVAGAGDLLLAAIRERVYQRSLPLATRTLRIELSPLGDSSGVAGAVHLVLDSLFSPDRLPLWLPAATPAGRPELADLAA